MAPACLRAGVGRCLVCLLCLFICNHCPFMVTLKDENQSFHRTVLQLQGSLKPPAEGSQPAP
jgi:hypothetical protein